MSKTFTTEIPSETTVDDMQRIDPTFLRSYLADPAAAGAQTEEKARDQFAELVDLADHSGFLNQIRQERMDNVAEAMAVEAGV